MTAPLLCRIFGHELTPPLHAPHRCSREGCTEILIPEWPEISDELMTELARDRERRHREVVQPALDAAFAKCRPFWSRW